MATKEELEQQLQLARKDVETLAGMAGERAKLALDTADTHIHDAMTELSEEARVLLTQARIQGLQWRGSVEDQIREKPLMTLGMAVGAGFLLANLLRR